MTICESCHLRISGPYADINGRIFHLDCCLCNRCGKLIPANEIVIAGIGLFHRKCLEIINSSGCAICGNRFLNVMSMDYWGNIYCQNHERQYSRCFSCGRQISSQVTGGGIDYADHRKICNICRKTIITEPDKAKVILDQVKIFYTGLEMNLTGITANIRFVDLKELAQESRDLHNIATGLTKATRIGSSTRPIGKINELLILIGLPMVHTSYILAHELCHVWFVIARFPELQPIVEEGMCELLSYLWLRSINTLESRYWMHRIDNNQNLIYGNGFQQARKNFNQIDGIQALLAYLRGKRTFSV
jgi:hypothetical protein